MGRSVHGRQQLQKPDVAHPAQQQFGSLYVVNNLYPALNIHASMIINNLYLSLIILAFLRCSEYGNAGNGLRQAFADSLFENISKYIHSFGYEEITELSDIGITCNLCSKI
jgi:hypothetical protein